MRKLTAVSVGLCWTAVLFYVTGNSEEFQRCALARRCRLSQATARGARMCQGTFFFTQPREDADCRRLLRLAGECARVYFCLHQWETPECGRIYLFYKKIRGKTVFLKEILDEPKFLWYDIRANGRYRSFFYAQKTIAMNREKAALQRN